MRMLGTGELRVPHLPGGDSWKSKEALELVDNIIHGFPIGLFVFWVHPAEAEFVQYGQFETTAPRRQDAIWILEGQQRILHLARVLLGHNAAEEDVPLSYDLEAERLIRSRSTSSANPWLPLTYVLDEVRLQDWLYERKDSLSRETRQRAFNIGRTIRDFQIPCMLIDADEQYVREYIRRLHRFEGDKAGQEALDAIIGASGERRSPAEALSLRLLSAGFGEFDPSLLNSLLRAILGEDIGRSGPLDLSPEHEAQSYKLLERAVKRAILFLRDDAGIPHMSLLPYEMALVTLTRFFFLHPSPSGRTRDLLSRWIWRDALAQQHSGDIGSKRRALRAIDKDEDRSVQRLLGQVKRGELIVPPISDFRLREARGKLLALVLVELGPLHLRTGESLIIDTDVRPDFLQTIFPNHLSHSKSLANRIIHPKIERLSTALADVGEASILASHGINRRAHALLRSGDKAGFLCERGETLRQAAEDLFARRTRWDEPDHIPVWALTVPEDE